MIRAEFKLGLCLTAGLLALTAACDPTYDPVCRGRGEHQLEAGELAQPSGMALANGLLYVANSAAVAPESGVDYCGSFVTKFTPDTGKAAGLPLMPHELDADGERKFYRFFSDVTYDTVRGELLVAERETGSVLKVSPSSGRILSRVAVGHAPYSVSLLYGVPTTWPGEPEGVTRDLLVVADIGRPGSAGHLWVVDLDQFGYSTAREVPLVEPGRPSHLAYDPNKFRLYVTLFDGTGVAVVDTRTLGQDLVTEAVLERHSMYIRGLAPAVPPAEALIYFTAESSAYAGVWVADDSTGELLENYPLPVPPFALALHGDKLIGLARNRLYVMERLPLRLSQTLLLGTGSPARLLVDGARNKAYITATEPSAVKFVELP